jgi:hypothetical protein
MGTCGQAAIFARLANPDDEGLALVTDNLRVTSAQDGIKWMSAESAFGTGSDIRLPAAS